MKKNYCNYIIVFCFLLIGFLTVACCCCFNQQGGMGKVTWPTQSNPTRTMSTPSVPTGFPSTQPTPTAVIPPAGQTEDYVPMKVGNEWNYQLAITGITGEVKMEMLTKINSTEQVSGATNYVLEIYIGGNLMRKAYYEKTAQGLIFHKVVHNNLPNEEYQPPIKSLDLPLQTGKSWSWKGNFSGKSGEYIFQVAGKEQITVPAGSFEAYRLQSQGRISDGTTTTSTSWFAKGVGLVKEDTTISYPQGHRMRLLSELKSYTVK